jgi:sugar O-acyltransferase (sialic acid O-acetyltransferase NeuD family)
MPMGEARPIVVYGAGGLGREVEWLLRRLNEAGANWRFEGYVVSNRSMLGPRDSTSDVVGDEAWLVGQKGLSVALGFGASRPRVEVGRRLAAVLGDGAFPSLIDPTAVMDAKSCRIAPGVVVCAGCILTVNVEVQRFAYLNLDCTVGHEAVIGEGVVLMPSVNVSGGVGLGAGAMVGTAAQILPYVTIGDGSQVGAGAVVTKDVASGTTVVGVPAQPLAKG